MAFDLGAVVAHIKADVSDFQSGIKKVTSQANGFVDTMKSVGTQAAIFTGVAAAGIGVFLKDSSAAANEFNKAMTTLDIIAGRFGESGAKAQQSAKTRKRVAHWRWSGCKQSTKPAQIWFKP